MEVSTVSSASLRTQSRVKANDIEQLRIHLVGIGGSGMAGLAAMLLSRGAHVSGSDHCPSSDVARLAQRGVSITTQPAPETLPNDAELVVASAAIPDQHPELAAARQRGIEVVTYAQMLGKLMAHYDGIAIAGTHGKSTTAAWLTFVLRQADLDPSFVVGARVAQLGGGSGVGAGSHFVAEACEYARSFLNLTPRRAAVLNIEEDHLDYYKDLAEIHDAFAEFAARVPATGLVVLNEHDTGCRRIAADIAARVETVGHAPPATWRAADVSVDAGCWAFDVLQAGTPRGRVRLGIAGRHNIDNALAVAALAHDCGVAWDTIATGLAEFRGVHRRLELRGQVGGVRVLDDYAHHPTEIRVTLQAVRERYAPRRLWCIFQPHQHSRTRFLLEDFAQSFRLADRVVVPDIYFVRDTERDRQAVSATDLVDRIRHNGGDASYVPGFDDIVALLTRETQDNDVVITMGAGTIWKVADELVTRLGDDRPR